MGIVLGTEAVVGIAEAAIATAAVAAEAAAETAADVATDAAAEAAAAAKYAAEAEAVDEPAAEATAEEAAAKAKAATEAAARAAQYGEDALASALETLNKGLVKLSELVEEYIAIDAVFKAAKEILVALFSNPSAQARAKKLEKLIKVLNQSSKLLNDLTDWLRAHSKDTTDINDITVTIQGVLSKFMPQLGAVSANECLLVC